jgi:rfaE bifunctional protein nucleotidyltransferase chain/domain
MKTNKKIVQYGQLPEIRQRASQSHQTIAFTTGVYDLLHLGHIKHFDEAKASADILVVSVGNDATVRALKGSDRPIYNERIRSQMIAALEVVDYVVISEESGVMDHDRTVKLLQPDVYVVPGDDAMLNVKRQLIESNGGKLLTVRRIPPEDAQGISTTNIIKQLRSH